MGFILGTQGTLSHDDCRGDRHRIQAGSVIKITPCEKVTSFHTHLMPRRLWSAVVSHLDTAYESLLRMALEKMRKGLDNLISYRIDWTIITADMS